MRPSLFVAAIASSFAVAFLACSDDPSRFGAHSGLQGKQISGTGTPDPGGGGSDGGGGGGTTPATGCVEANYVGDMNCSVKWSTDIWPLVSATGAWRCAAGDCHGGVQIPPRIEGEPDKAFADMMKHSINGKPYLNPCSKDLTASTFFCNMAGNSPACGKLPMPVGITPVAADIAKLKTWIECGAPKN
jgi:hypothetical protein